MFMQCGLSELVHHADRIPNDHSISAEPDILLQRYSHFVEDETKLSIVVPN